MSWLNLWPQGENDFTEIGRSQETYYKHPGVFCIKESKQGIEKYLFIKYHLKLYQKHKYLCDIHIKNSFFHLQITISNIVEGNSLGEQLKEDLSEVIILLTHFSVSLFTKSL